MFCPTAHTTPKKRTKNSVFYRFNFNGQERDDEVYGAGNAYSFEHRVHDPRLGRWFTIDPLAAKYPDLSSYSAMGLNPLYFIDPGGETLHVAGNVTMAETDILSTLPTSGDYRAKIHIINNEVVFNITHDEAYSSGDMGVIALYELINSPKKYLWEVDNIVVTNAINAGAIPDVNGIFNLHGMSGSSKEPQGLQPLEVRTKEPKTDKKGNVLYKKDGITPKQRSKDKIIYIPSYSHPPIGYDAGITMMENTWSYMKDATNAASRSSVAFHELVEMYFQNEVGMPRYAPHGMDSAHKRSEQEGQKLDPSDSRHGDGRIIGIKKP